MIQAEKVNCRRCRDSSHPNFGIRGRGEIKIMTVLERSDYRALQSNYEKELFKSGTGRTLKKILDGYLDNTLITNTHKCLLKEGRRVPKASEFVNCLPHLREQAARYRPRLVLCLGAQAARAFYPEQPFVKVVNKISNIERGQILVLHHPRRMEVWEKKRARRVVIKTMRQSG